MSILEDVATLIEDLDRGRATGRIYTYGQVQERLRNLGAAESARWPSRRTTAAHLKVGNLLPTYTRPRVIASADTEVSLVDHGLMRMNLRVQWPEMDASPLHVSTQLHRALDQLAEQMHEGIERELQKP